MRENHDPEAVVRLAEAAQAGYGFKNLKLKDGAQDGDSRVDTFIALKERFPEARIALAPGGCWLLADAIHPGKRLRGVAVCSAHPRGPEDRFSSREVMSESHRATGLQTATNMIAADWRKWLMLCAPTRWIAHWLICIS